LTKSKKPVILICWTGNHKDVGKGEGGKEKEAEEEG
jgi:hypothetical protein